MEQGREGEAIAKGGDALHIHTVHEHKVHPLPLPGEEATIEKGLRTLT